MRLSIAILVTLLLAVSAHAAEFTSSYTADNYVTAFSIDSLVVQSKTTTQWMTSQAYTGSLDPNVAHVFTWQVENAGKVKPSVSDPAAFLGQFTLGGTTYGSGVNTSNVTWSILGSPLQNYGTNGQSGIIWTNNMGKPISGISENARWIGQGLYPGSATFTVQANYSPVPIPGAAWLLGSGVAGLLAWRRRKAA